jgi:hypothetical protein
VRLKSPVLSEALLLPEGPERTAAVAAWVQSLYPSAPREDMIVDRLAAWQFWRSTTDGASAFLIWKAQRERLDLKRLESLGRRRKVESAYKKLLAFATDASQRSVSPEALERWAREVP